MFAVTYISQANCPFGQEEIHDLTKQASTKDASLSITGFLYFKERHFSQYPEEPTSNGLKLVKETTEDSRHTVVRTI